MPSIPLPFIVLLVLCLVLVRMVRQDRESFGLFFWVVAVCAGQAFLSGLHWGLGWQATRLIQPIIAALLPALIFAAFQEARREGAVDWCRYLPHLLPAATVLCLVVLSRSAIDFVLFATYLGYGLALLLSARGGPDGLAATRLGDSASVYKALVAMTVLMILTAFVDAGISLALVFGDARQANAILTVASVMWLAAAGYAATVADSGRPNTDPSGNKLAIDIFAGIAEPMPGPDSAIAPPGSGERLDEDISILRRIDRLMAERALYRDPDLTLDRLARRAGIPARRISAAINRIKGCNVSQLINGYRIEDAKRRLAATSDPVTSIMLEVGFGTKSNFHREFQRIAGMTPGAYRRTSSQASLKQDVDPSIQ